MSKASKYAEAVNAARAVHVLGFVIVRGNNHSTVVSLEPDGACRINTSAQLTAEEALKLRDWLTETFDDVTENTSSESAPK
jgi:hypothetical protein